MELTQNGQNPKQKDNIKWNDFLDVEENGDFEFKLINDGIGFHHDAETKSAVTARLKAQSKLNSTSTLGSALKRSSSSLPPSLENISLENPISSIPRSSNKDMLKKRSRSTMSVGYPSMEMPAVKYDAVPRVQKKSTQNFKSITNNPLAPDANEVKQKAPVRLIPAKVETRVGAFVIDLLVIAAISFLFLLFVSFVTSSSIDKVLMMIQTSIYAFYFGSIMGAIGIFYFTLLDCDQTVGKKIFSIKVVNKRNQKRSSLFQNLARALLFFAFLPALFNWQDVLTDTDVIQCS